MSAYVVKDAELRMKFNQFNFNEVETSVSVDLGLLEQKLQQQVEMEDKPKSRRKKRKTSFLPSTMETFKLRLIPRCTSVLVTAYGPALHRFIDAHKLKQLGMNFEATFENGFKISGEMKAEYGKNWLFGTHQR
ncbi:hypothetical protein Ocin01_19426 [Orchesella cincta]|uniref:Uncharacterized protein n=1 Tax=Orchesella cincta TaxID=48709 RepID=A0A1D2M2R3_ORCCI|nr:hypothetical protein Ocin01_19426 [Orchesella cincta]